MKKNIVPIVIILGLIWFVVMVVSSFMKSRQASRTSTCIGNLRCLDSAKEAVAREFLLNEGSIVSTSDVDRFIKGGTQCCKCPSDPSRTFNTSYSIGLIGSKPLCLINPGSHTL